MQFHQMLYSLPYGLSDIEFPPAISESTCLFSFPNVVCCDTFGFLPVLDNKLYICIVLICISLIMDELS